MGEVERTADGRYIVVRGRLWRASNPGLDVDTRERLTRELMAARRAKKQAMRDEDDDARAAATHDVDRTKRALGERGPVWWTDGAPDYTRTLRENTPYAQ